MLWSLAVARPGEEPSRSSCRPKLSAEERVQLIKAGLIEEEKRGRASHLLLADKGWEWAERQDQLRLSLSINASVVLEKLIQALRHYLTLHDVRLAEVIGSIPLSEDPGKCMVARAPSVELKEQVRNACLAITGSQLQRRVRLSDLRRDLAHIPREELDQTLKNMDRVREIQLMTLEQALEVNTEDIDAALSIAGQPMHILYLSR